MKQFIFLFLVFPLFGKAQNVGIGTAVPNANGLLHVDLGLSTNKGLLITGTYNASATVPDLGAGTRMMFYPGKAAFRAGQVDGTQWNNVNVGLYSVALGYNTISSGDYSVAMGYYSVASATASMATGQTTLASGIHSTAMGRNTTASGGYSAAMGYNTTASGVNSTAMGNNTTASGNFSTAMGNNVSTSNFDGAFVIGDNSTSTVMNSFVSNGFRSRFAGGYRLLSNAAASIGVLLLPDQNSWGMISDLRLKENFTPVPGEQILKSIAAMPQYTWNYKTQDPKTLRHYGPMAQDFYKAFGRDELGVIGCDTIINQGDFLGVNLIAIQALEKRTTELKEENSMLKSRLDKMEKLLMSAGIKPEAATVGTQGVKK